MKKLIYSIAITLSIMTIACKKDKTVSINGYWTGTGTDDGGSTAAPINFLFKNSNVARAYILSTDTTASLNGNGTYSIDPDSVRTTIIISSSTIVFTGKLNSSNNTMSGRYNNITSSIFGSFTVTKN